METRTEELTYSNPRREAVITDWPYGRLRTTATFHHETKPGKGERIGRTTVNPKNGRTNKTKFTTYSMLQRIVDGSDGRTYIAELSRYGMVHIRSSDMKHEIEIAHKSGGRSVRGRYSRDEGERFNDLLELFA